MHALFLLKLDPLYLPAASSAAAAAAGSTPAAAGQGGGAATAAAAAAAAAGGSWFSSLYPTLFMLNMVGVYTSLLLLLILIASDPGVLPKRLKGESAVEQLMQVRQGLLGFIRVYEGLLGFIVRT